MKREVDRKSEVANAKKNEMWILSQQPGHRLVVWCASSVFSLSRSSEICALRHLENDENDTGQDAVQLALGLLHSGAKAV